MLIRDSKRAQRSARDLFAEDPDQIAAALLGEHRAKTDLAAIGGTGEIDRGHALRLTGAVHYVSRIGFEDRHDFRPTEASRPAEGSDAGKHCAIVTFAANFHDADRPHQRRDEHAQHTDYEREGKKQLVLAEVSFADKRGKWPAKGEDAVRNEGDKEQRCPGAGGGGDDETTGGLFVGDPARRFDGREIARVVEQFREAESRAAFTAQRGVGGDVNVVRCKRVAATWAGVACVSAMRDY